MGGNQTVLHSLNNRVYARVGGQEPLKASCLPIFLETPRALTSCISCNHWSLNTCSLLVLASNILTLRTSEKESTSET